MWQLDVGSKRKLHNDSTGAPAMELALSIQRWMSKDDPDDDVGDVEKNAKGELFLLVLLANTLLTMPKAHTFVAHTLKALPTDTLTAKEGQSGCRCRYIP